jgi:hypothetical protein
LDAENIASAEEGTKKDGRIRHHIKREAAALSNLNDGALSAVWLTSDPGRFALEIRREVADHIWRAGGEVSADDLNAIKQALKKIGAGKSVPPPSRKEIANLDHAGITLEPAGRAGGREEQVVFDDLVLMLACVFWELTGSQPGWSNAKTTPKRGFRAFVLSWVEAVDGKHRGFRSRVARGRRMQKAVDRCRSFTQPKDDRDTQAMPVRFMVR